MPGDRAVHDLTVHAVIGGQCVGCCPFFKIEKITEKLEDGVLFKRRSPNDPLRCPSSKRGRLSRSASIPRVLASCSVGLRAKAAAFGGSSVKHQCRSMRRKPAAFSRKANRSLTKNLGD